MAPLEEFSPLVLPTPVSLELLPSPALEVVISDPVVAGLVDSVVVGVVSDGSTAGPEDELLDDPVST